jgi:hypothetical protein
MNTNRSRRQFLACGTTAALAGAVIPSFVPAGVLAAPGRPGTNDRINIGFIGIGRRAISLLGSAARLGEVRISGFADVNLKRAQENAATMKHAAEKAGNWGDVLACQDYRLSEWNWPFAGFMRRGWRWRREPRGFRQFGVSPCAGGLTRKSSA